ncbi:hypothetical protein [Streptomyces mirabilis]|uniref:hypothetical protein n=1 Tax=Streptomyces mirabilis TaxID=68239 RepID=UPI0033DC106A
MSAADQDPQLDKLLYEADEAVLNALDGCVDLDGGRAAIFAGALLPENEAIRGTASDAERPPPSPDS